MPSTVLGTRNKKISRTQLLPLLSSAFNKETDTNTKHHILEILFMQSEIVQSEN